jgi:hypothetical protein
MRICELQSILDMLLRQGIAFKRIERNSKTLNEQKECAWATEQIEVKIYTILRFTAKDEGVIGYGGFQSDMYFDIEGKLISLGVWE